MDNKKINFIVESLAKKVDSLNYQNGTYNKKARQEAKDRIQTLLKEAEQKSFEAGKTSVITLKQLENNRTAIKDNTEENNNG